MSVEAFLNKRVGDLETEIVVLKQTLSDRDKLLGDKYGKDSGKVQSLSECLTWIRENAVHGNQKFVDIINKSLEGK